ncbi:1-phosphofructokinase family hexose kinase [Bacillus sp. EB01]|uniref:1-phosphofructokinase family hexose kinase n=1 Tax=Bacillus sp. EB01 TaxID=1347086 RepID=UPI0005C5D4DE|nr:1-phosphofructokinase family hexose kinase [Bacillus sp. EB01]
MITTITLNPSIDRRYFIQDFRTGQMFRTTEYEDTAGGKGLNVTRVVHLLGSPVIATGLLGGKSGESLEEKLNQSGITHSFLKINGETRTCIAILSGAEQTEVLEPGPYVAEREVDTFRMHYDKLLERASVVVASGSMMRGMPVTLYRDLINKSKEKGIPFLLDTSGQALMEAIEAGPSFIKPNKEELEAASGILLKDDQDMIRAVDTLFRGKVETVMVSLGGNGALFLHEGSYYRVRIPKVLVKNPVGSGDSTVAGYAVGLEREYSFEKRIALAVASGTANAMEEATGHVNPDQVVNLMKQITVEKM